MWSVSILSRARCWEQHKRLATPTSLVSILSKTRCWEQRRYIRIAVLGSFNPLQARCWEQQLGAQGAVMLRFNPLPARCWEQLKRLLGCPCSTVSISRAPGAGATTGTSGARLCWPVSILPEAQVLGATMQAGPVDGRQAFNPLPEPRCWSNWATRSYNRPGRFQSSRS